MKKINIKGGKFAIVDDEDYEMCAKHKWYMTKIYAKTAIKVDGKYKTMYMHRMIAGAKPGEQIDHIDRNGLNNTRKNIRICTASENALNKKVRGMSKYLGVSIHQTSNKYYRKSTNEYVTSHSKARYIAKIRVEGKTIHIGLYECEIEAAKAYNEAAIKYRGKNARINIIPE